LDSIVYTGTHGIGHARLVCASDQSQRKTLSISVLLDQSRSQSTEV